MAVVQSEAQADARASAEQQQALNKQCTTLRSAKCELESSLQQETKRASDIQAALMRKTTELTDSVRSMQAERAQAVKDAERKGQAKLAAAQDAHNEEVASLQVRGACHFDTRMRSQGTDICWLFIESARALHEA